MTDCNVIADLIPLYIDNTCSKESSELIEEHIKTCEGCEKLLETMRKKGIEPKEKAPDIESKKLFKSVRKSFVIVIMSFLVMAASYSLNSVYPSFRDTWSFVTTFIYIAAWITLTVYVKDIIPLIGVNLAMAVITFFYGSFQFIMRALYIADIISVKLYVDTVTIISRSPVFYVITIPFHGISVLTQEWEFIHIVSAIVSLVVIIYSIISLKNWKKYRS